MAGIYTSYYAMLNRLRQDASLVPISISRSTPHWFSGKSASWLAPSASLLSRYKSGNLSHEDYALVYEKELLRVSDAQDVAQRLFMLAGTGKTPVLLCYEKSSDFCHRHLLAEWLGAYGITCGEYGGKAWTRAQTQPEEEWLKLC